jgi:hypothetical protein
MDLPDGSSPEAAHPVLLSLARVKGALDEADSPKGRGRGTPACSEEALVGLWGRRVTFSANLGRRRTGQCLQPLTVIYGSWEVAIAGCLAFFFLLLQWARQPEHPHTPGAPCRLLPRPPVLQRPAPGTKWLRPPTARGARLAWICALFRCWWLHWWRQMQRRWRSSDSWPWPYLLSGCAGGTGAAGCAGRRYVRRADAHC